MIKKSVFDYWKQVIYDYISCTDEEIDLSEEEAEKIVYSLLNDDELWTKIGDTIDYYLHHK